MTLEEFIAGEHDRIEAFKKMWLEKSKTDPENWPDIMEPGEWDQQLLAFELSADSNSTERDEEQIAREKLNATLDKFVEEVREVIQRKINDHISVDEVVKNDEKQSLHIVLGWVQRIMIETIEGELGSKMTAHHFDNAYFQICSQHIGPDDFSKKAKPYKF